MVLNVKPEIEHLTGVRKAAMLLIVLGEQASAGHPQAPDRR